MPERPVGWLYSVARRRVLDGLRRGERVTSLPAEGEIPVYDEDEASPEPEDDRLRLLFLCCHPALTSEAQVALTLNAACGLQASEVARAFLVAEKTMAQRIVRAKAKIRGAGIPFELPPASKRPERLALLCQVIYLIFNEGNTATTGEELQRRDLLAEALQLGECLCREEPREPEVLGLMALMMLHDARRAGRIDATGLPLSLEEQDRSLWNEEVVQRGTALLDRAMREARPGPYQVQAAIAALHAEAPSFDETDWEQIALLYERLAHWRPHEIVRLNRAVALGRARGAERGLAELQHVEATGRLDAYPYLHAAKGGFQSELGRTSDALESYRAALACCSNEAERRFLKQRMDSL